jgi:hypothetical protein
MSGDHDKYHGTCEVPKREWVGLTGDERSQIRSEYLQGKVGLLEVCDFCEAKLKEKNYAYKRI